jgi:regulator of RNase E activity RraB
MISAKEAREKALAAEPIRVARETEELRKTTEIISKIINDAVDQGFFMFRVDYAILKSKFEKSVSESLRKEGYIVTNDYEFPEESGDKRGKKIGIKVSW